MWRLIYPLQYLRLKNSEKRRLDIVATIFVTIFIASIFLIIPGVSFFRPNGFLDKILVLTSALTGFYVAALVAAATFDHPDLDKVIKVGPVALIVKGVDGKKVQEWLTRRELVCNVFGYLAFSTFVLSLLSAILVGTSTANLLIMSKWNYIGKLFVGNGWFWLRGTVIVSISVIVAHVCVTTSLGIYYLMDRLYRRDRQITTKKPTANKDVAA